MTSTSTSRLSKTQPQYLSLAQTLLRGIESGRYPVDSLLPTESELVREYGMSRHTVREAMRQLQQMGLISRQQGVGTKVRAKTAVARYVQTSASIADLIQYAKDVRLVIRSEKEIVAEGDLCELLHSKPGQRWLKLQGVRYTERRAKPICHTDVYVAYQYASIREQIQKAGMPIYALIERESGSRVQEVQQNIRALAIGSSIAKELGVSPASPGLCITRHYISADGSVFEVAISIYPAERFSYSMRLRLDTQRSD